MNLVKVTNPLAKAFLEQFLRDREIIPYVFNNNHKIISYNVVSEKGNQMTYFEIEKR